MKAFYDFPEHYRECPCSFKSGGSQLSGILTTPPAGVPLRGGIVFSHGWSGFRSGPSGIFTVFARAFAHRGYASLRFDFRGRGESQGNGLAATLSTMGEDLLAATRFFQRECSITKPAYCGICSGGNVIVGCLDRLPAPSALLLLSVYPFSDGDSFGRDVHRTWHFLGVYMHKLMRGDTWKRFFKGEVSLKNVCSVLFGHLVHTHRNSRKEGVSQPSPKTVAGSQQPLPRAVKAATQESRATSSPAPRKYLHHLKPGMRGVMVYGSGDPDAQAAQNYYGDYLQQHGIPINLYQIPDANHNFSRADWRTQAFARLVDALEAEPETNH